MFEQFAKENSASLSVLGVVATVTGLFLNLNLSTFPIALREIQFLLLLLLITCLVFVIYNTVIWMKRNADSEFSGLMASTLLFLLLGVGSFTKNNFSPELKQYLLSIILVVMLFSYSFVWRYYRKMKQKIDVLESKILKPTLYGIAFFLFMYIPAAVNSVLADYSMNLKFNPSKLFIFFDMQMIFIPVWFTVLSFALENLQLRSKSNYLRNTWVVFLCLPVPFFVFYILIRVYPHVINMSHVLHEYVQT